MESKMSKQEKMKKLYLEKPKATFLKATKDGLYYSTEVNINFLIPFSDIQDGIFEKEMEGKLLSRYILD